MIERQLKRRFALNIAVMVIVVLIVYGYAR
jgi:hypothetical protein